MHNVWIIIRREYLERVRTKSFWVMTFLVPALMGAAIILPSKLMMSQKGEAKHIAVIASTTEIVTAVDQALARTAQDGPGDKYTVDAVTPGTSEQLDQQLTRVENGQLDGVLVATDDALNSKELKYSSRNNAGVVETGVLTNAGRMAYMERELKKFGVPRETIDTLQREKFDLKTERVSLGKKATQTSSRSEFFATLTLVMILYMSIIMHGIAVMRSVLEEKTSRIVEVLLASVTAKELMAGKIIGVGAVGFTQLALWYAAGMIFAGPALIAARNVMGPMQIPVLALAMYPVFFTLGYFLYATLWAMLGAMSNSDQEAQQMQFFVMMPLIFSTIVMVPALTNPNSPMAVGFSLFPFSTPLVMYARVAVQGAPVWQIALSIALMLGAVYVVLVVASRIYRVGILMYGKRPTLPELVKWFRYA
jgi:ABC-2 type transport system permease protein